MLQVSSSNATGKQMDWFRSFSPLFKSPMAERRSTPPPGRTRGGFEAACRENALTYEIIYADMGNTFEENKSGIVKLVRDLEKRYPDQKKGIFMPNDTHANVLLNVLLRKYGELPDAWQIIGFDDSPILIRRETTA